MPLTRTPGRTAVVAIAPLAAAALVFAASCSSDTSTTTTSATTSPPSATESPSATTSAPTTSGTSSLSTQDQQEITNAFMTFFAGSSPAATKLQYVQDPANFAETINAQSGSGLATTTTATVAGILGTAPGQASVTYTILMGGQPALTNQTGVAVQENGKWLVSAATFCDLLTLENGGTAPPECVGVELPGVSAEPTTGAATTS